MTLPDLKGKVDPDWCPGCGDFGVLAALQKALVELQIQPHNVVTISGIGCSSNLPGYINTYGMHTLHGRALAVATGVKLANHELTVVVTGGDGDGFGIGGNHFIHTMRRNVDLLYIVMDNQIYGLTTGQTSPTSRVGMKTKSTPFGNVEAADQSDPAGACRRRHLRGPRLQRRAETPDRADQAGPPAQGLLLHRRLQPLRDLQPRQHLPMVQAAREEAGGRCRPTTPSNWMMAMEKSQLWGDEIPIGKFFQRTDRPSLEQCEPVLDEGGPLAHRDLRIPAETVKEFIAELM